MSLMKDQLRRAFALVALVAMTTQILGYSVVSYADYHRASAQTSDSIIFNVTDVYTSLLYIAAESDQGTLGVDSIEYRVGSAGSWQQAPSSYEPIDGDTFEEGVVPATSIPIGENDIYIRATDSEGATWEYPNNPVTFEGFEITVEIEDEGTRYEIYAYEDGDGFIKIDDLQYTFDPIDGSENWEQVPPNGSYGSDSVSGTLEKIDLGPGSLGTLTVRAIDEYGNFSPREYLQLENAKGYQFFVEVYEDDEYFEIEVGSNEDWEGVGIEAIQYSIDSGNNWVDLDALDPPYGNTFEYAEFSPAQIFPPGEYDIEIRAVDSTGFAWVFDDTSGILDNVQGNGSNLEFELDIEDSCDSFTDYCVEIYVYDLEYALQIASVQYRIDGGDWNDLSIFQNPDPRDRFYADAILPDYDIPTGNVNIEFRAYDDPFGLEWPQDQNYPSISFSEGKATNEAITEIYSEGFNVNPGNLTEGQQETGIGDEWEYDRIPQSLIFGGTATYGRARIQGGAFASEGSAGLTFDSITADFFTGGRTELVLSQDLSNYRYSSNLQLSIDYMWNNSGSGLNNSFVNTNNTISIREDSGADWQIVHNFAENPEPGVFKEIVIDLDQAMFSTYPDSDFQVKFDSLAYGSVTSPTGVQGYTIDNLRIEHAMPEGFNDLTPPELSLNQDIPSIVSTDYVISGNAVEDFSNITAIEAEFFANGNLFSSASAIAIDGNFDSISEAFTLLLPEQVGNYELELTVVNSAGLSQTYTYLFAVVDDQTPPQIEVVTPQELDNLPTEIEIKGVASEDVGTISGVVFNYNSFSARNITINAVADDGSFDSDNEPFTITLTGGASLERYDAEIIVINNFGVQNILSFSGIVENFIEFELDNFGQEKTNDTTPTFTGRTSTPKGVEIVSIEYAVTSGIYEVDWTPVSPVDGAFDSDFEEFTFTTPALRDGDKNIRMRATNNYGDISGVFYDRPAGFLVDRISIEASDDISPIIELQSILPDPIYDDTPVVSGKVADDTEETVSNIVSIEYSLNSGDWQSVTPADGAIGDETIEEFTFELPQLNPGNHTVRMRAEDAAGRNTDDYDRTVTEEFTFVLQDDDAEPAKITKTADFLTHDDHDLIASEDTIWGRDRLRLRQYVSIANQTQLLGDNFGPRYQDVFIDQVSMDESDCYGGGIWIAKEERNFSFYDLDTANEYEFNLDQFGFPSSHNAQEIVSHEMPDGSCHVWVGSQTLSHNTIPSQKLLVDFGPSVEDGPDSHTVYAPVYTPNPDPNIESSISVMRIDDRDPGNYGIYFRFAEVGGGVGYIKPGSDVASQADDQSIIYRTSGDLKLNNTSAIFRDGNRIVFADYNLGISMLDDNGTPLDPSDDQRTSTPALSLIFDINMDKQGRYTFAGSNGLYVLEDDDDTFQLGDDRFYHLIRPDQLNFNGLTRVQYIPGDDVIGEQYFVGDRAGNITYFGTNDTLRDRLDDEVYTLNVSNRYFPSTLNDFFLTDENNIYALIYRYGLFSIELDREFAEQGTAITKAYAEFEGQFLYADFVELVSADWVYDLGTTSFRVSNDGGFNWQPITIGETVEFDNNEGYQVVLAIDMQRGSTPVLEDYLLTYSAYKDEESRGLVLDVEDEPAEVVSGSEFSFRIEVLDDLLNPVDDDTPVSVELRDIDGNVIAEFNIEDLVITGSTMTINNAVAPVVGPHYIHISNSEASANSEIINFVDPVDLDASDAPTESDVPDAQDEPDVPGTPDGGDVDSNEAQPDEGQAGSDEDSGNELTTTETEDTSGAVSESEDENEAVTATSDENLRIVLVLAPAALATLVTLISSAMLTTFIGGVGRLLTDLLVRFGILLGIIVPRKRKYWGIVFDVEENKTIPFAVVRLYNQKRELVEQTFSDLEGRYGILLEQAGTYQLLVEAGEGYQLFQKEMRVNGGNDLEVIQDVPMLKTGKQFGWFAKLRFYNKNRIIAVVRTLLLLLMFLGFGYTLYVTMLYPVLLNIIMLLLYGLLFAINATIFVNNRATKKGRVVEADSGKGLGGVSLRLYEGEKQVGVYLSNSEGLLKINADQGKYWFIAYKKGYDSIAYDLSKGLADTADQPSTGKKQTQLPELEIKADGYLSQDIVMRKADIEKGSIADLVENKGETI
jgi:hypothetical protein